MIARACLGKVMGVIGRPLFSVSCTTNQTITASNSAVTFHQRLFRMASRVTMRGGGGLRADLARGRWRRDDFGGRGRGRIRAAGGGAFQARFNPIGERAFGARDKNGGQER